MPQNAKSAYIHLLEGNPNNKTKKELNKRLKNEEKMKLSDDQLVAPSWLSTSGKKVFKQVVEIMKPTKLLNNADLYTIAMFSDAVDDYIKCCKQIKKNGFMIKGKVNPFIKQKQAYSTIIKRYGNDLGLSPAARASLSIHIDDGKENTDDEFD